MRTITVANRKGGCGKTTTAVNLAAAFAVSGFRVLIIDLDPQGHATWGFGVDPNRVDRTVYDVFTSQSSSLSDVTLKTKQAGLCIVPSNTILGMAELELRNVVGKELILCEKLQYIEDHYDYCIIDCCPPLSLLMLNALVASDDVVITVQPHWHALEGVKHMLDTVDVVRKRFPHCHVSALGILLTFVDTRTLLCRHIQEQLHHDFNSLVFDCMIHVNTRLAEAPGAGEPIISYAPTDKGAREYCELATEIVNRIDSFCEHPVTAY